MKDFRKKLIEWLFEHSQHIYTQWFKYHKPWGIYRNELLSYPEHSFGRHLGSFLQKNNFELIAKVERHDAYHTLTGYGTKVEDEIALQCLCFGNGKRSPYLYGAMILGVAILPEYYVYYHKSYTIGKNANPFHQFDYKQLLYIDINDLRQAIFSEKQRQQLSFHTDDRIKTCSVKSMNLYTATS
ncbi:ubiquinone biosynthesis protein COQ4 [Psychroserpens algicola]|uniref:Ubiquinone biosynthesis protein COQ4 n=1 Tax=Psychroserpens algicola TaxID=1719034 RepID=A0ABT0H707_9FLAO|nr:ubiquinone biosynthesis protein COQ4 [Psychroserpens algicola]MCK8480148.1 ubiquinone biosynthesis protein COQ4 [Psychroserpens algicola]